MPWCPFALARPVPNHGGPIGQVRLGVVHVMEGTLAGTDSWFHNPSSQVSAHFGVGKDGTLYQWVDTSNKAWAEADYNDVAISIEHEGNSGDSLTYEQIVTDSKLLGWLKEVPLVRTSDPNGSGWIGHGELGVAGGNHPDCPGQPILNQLPIVIAMAKPEVRVVNNPVDAVLAPGKGSWVLTADGGVEAFGAPFHGSYPGLPEKDRQGTRSFVAIQATLAGYAIIADDGNVYSFPTPDEPV